VVPFLESLAVLLEMLDPLGQKALVSTLSILVLPQNILEIVEGRILIVLARLILTVIFDIDHVLVEGMRLFLAGSLTLH
jgi:hypothetical protein